MPSNPWFSKPDLRRAVSSVADSGLVVTHVEFRHDAILVHTDRMPVRPVPSALAGTIGLADRLSSRRGKSLGRPAAKAIHSVSSP
jgi:hypothetical protein